MRPTLNRENYLTLKWGSLKSYDFSSDEEGKLLLRKYFDLGTTLSAIQQHDTKKQKKIICQLIDLCYGKILLEWDDKLVSKKEAKKYVMEY